MSDFIVEVSGETNKEPSGGPAALSVGAPITRAAGRRKRGQGGLDLGEKKVRKAANCLGS
jgi:hypothetical protein